MSQVLFIDTSISFHNLNVVYFSVREGYNLRLHILRCFFQYTNNMPLCTIHKCVPQYFGWLKITECTEQGICTQFCSKFMFENNWNVSEIFCICSQNVNKITVEAIQKYVHNNVCFGRASRTKRICELVQLEISIVVSQFSNV